jgi:hypothetical protein
MDDRTKQGVCSLPERVNVAITPYGLNSFVVLGEKAADNHRAVIFESHKLAHADRAAADEGLVIRNKLFIRPLVRQVAAKLVAFPVPSVKLLGASESVDLRAENVACRVGFNSLPRL